MCICERNLFRHFFEVHKKNGSQILKQSAAAKFLFTNLSALFDVLNSLAHFLFAIFPCSSFRLFAFSHFPFSALGQLRISHRWLPKCGTSFAFKMFSPAHFLPQLWLFIWHISLCLPIQRWGSTIPTTASVGQVGRPMFICFFFQQWCLFFSAVRYFAVFSCCVLSARVTLIDFDYHCDGD